MLKDNKLKINHLKGLMNTYSLSLFMFLFFLNAYQSVAMSFKEDTIIVKVGERKKIIFWGETKEDLKDLEKYDLNLIIRQMNQDLDEMPADLKRMYRRDYNGNSFDKIDEEETEYQTPWQKLKRNTYLNFSLGMTSANILLRNTKKNSIQPFNLPQELYQQKIYSSPHFNIGLIRHERFIRNQRKEILLRYGLDFSWFYLNYKSTKQEGYEINYGIQTDTLLKYVPTNGNYYLAQAYHTSTTSVSTWVPIPKESLFYTNFRVIPTINFFDRENRQTFSFGFGGYIGTLLSGSQIIKKEDSADKRGVKIPLGGDENPVRYGVLVNIGYRAINLFIETDANNLFIDRKERTTWSQNLTTIGFRFGK